MDNKVAPAPPEFKLEQNVVLSNGQTEAAPACSQSKLPAFRPLSPSSVPPVDKAQEPILGKQQLKERKKQIQAHTKSQIKQAKRNASIQMPPPDVSIFASTSTMGYHLGVGMGLYFQLLEWLMIMFACTTFLSIPYWIVINQSVFTDEANKDDESVGLKVFDEASMLSTTFASIVGPVLDPNNTLVYMNTKLGSNWYGPMDKDDFLLWISLLDIVGVVTAIFLVTYFTWKAGWFELEVDKNSYDATDYAVLVTGLPPDAGFHEIGHFFSRFGEVMDVTLVLDMELVLKACARASKLEHKRELQQHYMRMLPMECRETARKRVKEIEDELIQVLKDINEAMDKQIAINKREQARGLLQKSSFLGPQKRNKAPDVWMDTEEESRQVKAGGPVAESQGTTEDDVERPHAQLGPKYQAVGLKQGFYKNTFAHGVFKRETVYATKAAFVTFNRMSEARECLKLTPNPGFTGWLYSHTVVRSAQCMRGYCIETKRAGGPSDYIFENMCLSKQRRFWRRMWIRILYLVMLIACALIVSGLSSRTRVELDRTSLDFKLDDINVDIGHAASFLPGSAPADSALSKLRTLYEEAMQRAASSSTTPAFSSGLAAKANFTDYCTLALPDVCAEHYRSSLGDRSNPIGLNMTFRRHFEWSNHFEQVVYTRPLLTSLTELARASNPARVKGTDVGLSACPACYCLGLSLEDASEQKSGAWLAMSQQHCSFYASQSQVEAATETAVTIVIVVLNVTLKLFVQFLSAKEMQWTRSQMERSFCVVAYMSQLLNSVLVVMLVNARPNARSSETGSRINEDDIQWLRYIILGGSFDDFSPAWYEYVGQSFMILLFIQLLIPFINILIEYAIKWFKRGLVRCDEDATQDQFNDAYNYPQFLLQQRVADVMLNISVAMLFYSGMPLCSAVVILVFAITNLVDRWAVVSLMTVTRYSSELPHLILGLLPIAVFFHCCFGLWMHTFFMIKSHDSDSTAIFIQMGAELRGKNKIDDSNHFGYFLDGRSIASRMSQPNGFGLLLLVFIMFLYLVFRYVISGWLNPMIRQWLSGKEQEALENPEDGAVTDSQAYRFFRKIMAMPKLQLPGMPTCPDDNDDDELTFEEALVTEKLQGIPTFRLPFHPRYADVFSGLLHGAIWFKMLGPYRYTRLVPTKELELLCLYQVIVKTSNIAGAGTDSDILVVLHGERNGKAIASRPQNLDTYGNNFERGREDKFEVKARDVGRINHIEVRSCGRGFGAAWHLDSVTVTDTLRGMTYHFPCSRWLDPRHPKSLLQKLHPTDIAAPYLPKANNAKAGDVGLEGKAETVIEFVDATGAAREMEASQRQKKLSRVKLGWRVSPTLILDAGEASLDDNCYDLRERGLGPKLSAYVASMAQRAEVPLANTPEYARQHLQRQQTMMKQQQEAKAAARRSRPSMSGTAQQPWQQQQAVQLQHDTEQPHSQLQAQPQQQAMQVQQQHQLLLLPPQLQPQPMQLPQQQQPQAQLIQLSQQQPVQTPKQEQQLLPPVLPSRQE